MPLSYQNSVEFALISQSRGRVVIPEPINFDDGNGNIYERDKDSKGFLKTKSNQLEYFGEGFDFLLGQYVTKGVAEDVLQQKRIKSDDRLDERWRTASETFLDLGEAEFDEDRNVVKTKAIQGGIYKQIKNALNDEFDLVSKTSSNGNEIGALETVTVPLTPREIFLRSEASVEDGLRISAPVTGADTLNARCIPFQFDINSDRDNLTNAAFGELSAGGGNYAQLTFDKISNVFLSNAETDKTITLNGKIKATIVNANSGSCNLDIVIYSGGNQYLYDRKIPLDSCNPGILGEFVEFNFTDYILDVSQGESVAFGLLSDTSDGIEYEITETKLTVTEDSGLNFPTTNCRAITPFVLAERLVAKITGERNCFKSDLIETGDQSNRLLTQGYWVRGFPDIVNEGTEEERKIQFKTSLEDLFKHFDTLEPIAWWTEKVGNKEVVRLEPLKYTQQNFIGVQYGQFVTDNSGNKRVVYIQASDIKRKNLKDNFYSKIIIGSDKGGENYEEIAGLQSISGKAEFATINPTDSTYERLSPYALGDIDHELPRRKPFENYPDEDTKYDSIISCLDCKVIGGKYYLKKWQDVYESAPTGIYRVNSAYNLEFTPARLLLKHGFVINAGLYHYQLEKIRFSSSNCNSSFISKKASETFTLKESPEETDTDYGIEHAWLEKPRVKPKSVDFTLQVEQELEDQITGIHSSGAPNWFGLVAVDTGSTIEYMRLVKADTNKEGKHKLVEAYV